MRQRLTARASTPIRSTSSLPAITARQIEIVCWVQEGKSASDIGGILNISKRTVEHHLEKLCANLGVRTRFQAVLKMRDLGLITADGRWRLPPIGTLTSSSAPSRWFSIHREGTRKSPASRVQRSPRTSHGDESFRRTGIGGGLRPGRRP
jgi:DNA-binding CsgD family transcriptional regulator